MNRCKTEAQNFNILLLILLIDGILQNKYKIQK